MKQLEVAELIVLAAVAAIVISIGASLRGRSETALESRTTGLDPQGHLVAGRNPTGDPCPGQYPYYLYGGGGLGRGGVGPIILECWGTR